MLSLEHFLYSKFQNVGAVFLQTSLGLAITLPNPEDVEQSGKEFPSILQVMSILAQSRQMHLFIGHSMEEKLTHLRDFKRRGK